MRRREFLQLPAVAAVPFAGPRKKIAALTTTYHVRSHADDIITRFLEGYWINDRYYASPCDIVSLYIDQVHPADIGYRLAAAYNFPVVGSISDALTRGTGKLAVDGVLLVAEHGDYPFNEKLQKLYPRGRFFHAVTDVFRASGRGVPVFVDKHLSYSRPEARGMVDQARELSFPL